MLKTAYYGNPFLGLFFRANNSVALAPIDAQDKSVDAIERELGVKVVKTLIGGSNLLGIYTAMNSNGIIMPNIAEHGEVAALRKEGMNVFVSSELNNAHGNNLCVNDKGGIINPHVDSAHRKKMEDALGIELVPLSIAKHTTVGSACVASNKGFLAHYAANEDEMKAVGDALRVPGDKGTVNTGAGYVSSGLVHNDRGFVAGEASTGFELGKIESALGYLG
ncbi:Translation initiation factor 6 [uncultured archaeon]|nr:Translation initiation factor 6 [uncultured archaeon]